MAITPLPTPPQRSDPDNFSARADAFMVALPTFGTEANALALDVNSKQADAASSASSANISALAAKASSDAASLATNTTKWVSGKTYAEGENVWSPADFQTYRRKTIGAGTTDPSLDLTNWKSLSGFALGDVLLTSRVLDSPAWLPSNGADYLASSYPGLAGLIGPVRDPVKLPDPSSLPAGFPWSSSYSGDGAYLALSFFTSPYISVYKQTDGAYVKLAALPAITYIGYSVVFSPDGNYLAVGGDTTPFITIYKRTGDTFAKLTVTTGVTAKVSALSFSPDGSYLAVGHDNTPFLTVLKRVGDVFTKLTNPATIPSGIGVLNTVFSPDGQHLMLGLSTNPSIMVYKRTGDVFTNLPGVPYVSGGVSRAAYSPDGKYLVTGLYVAPYLAIFSRTSDTYTQVYNIIRFPPQAPNGIAFSPITGELAIATTTTPGVLLYQQVAGDFKIVEGFPTVASSYSVAFSPVGYDLAVGLASTPYLSIIRSTPDYTRLRVPNLPASDSRLINYIKT